MLKLSAYADRRLAKDLNGFLHCTRNYEDVDAGERRYGLEHQGSLVPLEFGGAFLLGLDGVRYQSRDLQDKLQKLLGSLQRADAPGLGEAARDAGRLPTDERWLAEGHQLIEWYRLGARL
jgi:hypothetical protein